MGTPNDIAPEFRRAYLMQYLRHLGYLPLPLLLLLMLLLSHCRWVSIDEMVSYLKHDAFSAANLSHIALPSLVVSLLIVFIIILLLIQGNALRKQLRKASIVLQQAVPEDVTAKCWQRAGDSRLGVWRVSIFDQPAAANPIERVCNTIAVSGPICTSQDPLPGKLYRLEAIPEIWVLRFSNGVTAALAPQQQAVPPVVVATAPGTAPAAGTPSIPLATQGTIDPRFRKGIIGNYLVMLFFFAVTSVPATFFFRYPDEHQYAQILPGGGLLVIAVVCLIFAVSSQSRLRLVTTILRQATPKSVLVKCWKTPNGRSYIWNIAFIDPTHPSVSSSRKYIAFAYSGKLLDSDEPQSATWYALDTNHELSVVTFPNNAVIAMTPSGMWTPFM